MSNNPYQSPLPTDDRQPVPSGEVHANCPGCQSVYATKVKFTLWGGALGPKLFHHVKCDQCGTKYNGRSGKSNLVPILIYNLVAGVIMFIAGFAIAMTR
ncbi:hypothetical protein SV7mr_10030 [Stieleria bergensis]|uniref:Uncharacterized protein n=1 Tax=Stieleria bergensis TaxID=2528025 RepID=A0A517SQV7_9BACT|nr:MAG: hypothetical protein CBB71_14350 [Rhodopirellula sp. TMED11]QDT58510.1 hypothetical protein SV7mr_10030 [Planctomycetes bacterium SV_7m_r]